MSAHRKVGRAVNWNRHPKPREKKPYLMGEGLGNCLGLEGPKYTRDARVLEQIAYDNWVYATELRKQRSEKKAREKKQHISFLEILASKEASGEILVDQRIFYSEYVKRGWEARAKQVGGLPEGIDIALTDYGLLFMVPVIEEDTAKKLGIDKVAPGVKPRRDGYGRPFWVQAELKDTLTYIFGLIRWNRPLSIREAKQFGVRVK